MWWSVRVRFPASYVEAAEASRRASATPVPRGELQSLRPSSILPTQSISCRWYDLFVDYRRIRRSNPEAADRVFGPFVRVSVSFGRSFRAVLRLFCPSRIKIKPLAPSHHPSKLLVVVYLSGEVAACIDCIHLHRIVSVRNCALKLKNLHYLGALSSLFSPRTCEKNSVGSDSDARITLLFPRAFAPSGYSSFRSISLRNGLFEKTLSKRNLARLFFQAFDISATSNTLSCAAFH